NIDVEDLRAKVGEHTAGLMLTNPSTLGLFDENIQEIARIFHSVGALMYYDGANLNAVCGISRPGDMGFDIVHINLHKTFSQPHGGGGPGGGPIAVAGRLARLREAYDLPFDRLCMHEFVLSARRLKRERGVTALDVAKRLMDYGFHPPTIYFPLIVPEALMIEPTETEAKETLDAFADAML